MALRPTGKVPKDLETLFRSGRIGDLNDGALLERFLTAHDEAAFESLVGRHGPMVLRVCLATLADPTDVDDAFQAVKALALAALARGQAKAGDLPAANASLRDAHARAQAIRAPRGLDRRQSRRECLPRSS